MPKGKENRSDALIIVLAFMVVAGMAVALLVIVLWRNHVAAITDGVGFAAAVALCPPFMLVRAVGGTEDTTLNLLVTTGTIVIANASLYGGMAAFVLWVLSVFQSQRRAR